MRAEQIFENKRKDAPKQENLEKIYTLYTSRFGDVFWGFDGFCASVTEYGLENLYKACDHKDSQF